MGMLDAFSVDPFEGITAAFSQSSLPDDSTMLIAALILQLSKISWLPDILVFRSSILPIVLGPVLSVTLFSAGVAAASLWWGKEVGLTNNVVPLLSVVVGLLMVFRGRKDFTSLISNARSLSRNIWVAVSLPAATLSASGQEIKPALTRTELTLEKKRLIRLIVAFVVATKHHLRDEGGVHHDDLKGLLPPRLAGSDLSRLRSAPIAQEEASGADLLTASPRSMNGSLTPSREHDEEAALGLTASPISSPARSHPALSPSTSFQSQRTQGTASPRRSQHLRPNPRSGLKRRPTGVRIVVPDDYTDQDFVQTRRKAKLAKRAGPDRMDERTPLIKAGVKPDSIISAGVIKRAELGLGRMVELGLPLIIAHEISRTIFRFRRMGCLEAVGPAGMNAMQSLVQSMTDQLGSMERIVQTPLPYVFCIHLKQVVSLYLFLLPFTLVDAMGWKMVFIMFCISMVFMGVEGIAAMIEMPFGTDPCDLNLDLYCTELLCECEAILERLPEGDEEDDDMPTTTYQQTSAPMQSDYGADDGDDDD